MPGTMMVLQPYTNGAPTANGPSAYITWEGFKSLTDRERDLILEAVTKLNTVASCHWASSEQLMVTRQSDLVWVRDVGQDIAAVVGDIFDVTMTLQRSED